MLRIDAHQHFWRFDPVRDAWITDDMAVIRRDFLPEQLAPLLQDAGVAGCVAVQADQSEAETNFLLALADQYEFIRGVVGWVDLQADNVEERLAHYAQFSKLKGFRHVLQGEQNRSLMLTPAFKRGIQALQAFGFTYDVLIFPDQLGYAAELLAAFPEQRFVIDHIAKPDIKQREIAEWKKGIRAVAAPGNAWCKVSGLITEANWKGWQPADFRPYLDTVFEAFGPEKILFGSDWPVCLLAGRYPQVVGLLEDYLTKFSAAEQAQFWAGNACEFYHL